MWQTLYSDPTLVVEGVAARKFRVSGDWDTKPVQKYQRAVSVVRASIAGGATARINLSQIYVCDRIRVQQLGATYRPRGFVAPNIVEDGQRKPTLFIIRRAWTRPKWKVLYEEVAHSLDRFDSLTAGHRRYDDSPNDVLLMCKGLARSDVYDQLAWFERRWLKEMIACLTGRRRELTCLTRLLIRIDAWSDSYLLP